jgi:signal transduction histidine kinase
VSDAGEAIDARPLGVPMRELMERTGLGVAVADATGRLVVVSPALADLFRVNAEAWALDGLGAALGMRQEDGSPLAREDTPMSRALSGEFVKDAIVGAHDDEGRLLWLCVNGGPILGSAGRPVGGFILVQDITAQRAAAELAEEFRRRLVVTVNHELRTPLAALLDTLDSLGDVPSADPDLVRSLGAIRRASVRLAELVDAASALVARQEELHRVGRQPDGPPVVLLGP